MAQSVGNLAVVLSANAQQLAAGFTEAEARLNAFAQKVAGLGTKLGPAFRQFTDPIAGKVGDFASVVGSPLTTLVNAASSLGSKAASEFMNSLERGMAKADEKLVAKIKFRHLVGDPAAADAMAAQIKAATGSGLLSGGDLMGAAGRLFGAGMGPGRSAAMAKALGNVGFVTGRDVGDLAGVVARINADGKVSARELDRAGVAGLPLKDIALELGHTVAGLRAAVERGEVSLDQFTRAVVAAGEKFGKSVSAISEGTALGSEKRLEKAWDRFDATVAGRFGEAGLAVGLNNLKAKALDFAGGAVANNPVVNNFLPPSLFERVRAAVGPAADLGPTAEQAKVGAAFLREKAEAAADLVRRGFGALGAAVEQFGTPLADKARAARLAIDAQFGPGASGPFAAFAERVKMINEAGGAFGGGLPLAPGVRDRALVAAFGDLERQFGDTLAYRPPPALTRGSQAAERAIAAAAGSFAGDRQDAVKAILEAARKAQERTEINTRKTAEALQSLGVTGLGTNPFRN